MIPEPNETCTRCKHPIRSPRSRCPACGYSPPPYTGRRPLGPGQVVPRYEPYRIPSARIRAIRVVIGLSAVAAAIAAVVAIRAMD